MKNISLVSIFALSACISSKTLDSGTPEESDSGLDETDTYQTGETDPLSDCAEDLEEPLSWFEETTTESLDGALEFGQTHVTKENEHRISASLIANRATLILFAPDTPLPEEIDVRIGAWKNNELIGVLPMSPPSRLPKPLETDISSIPIEPYNEVSWSTLSPYSWFDEGIVLKIGYVENDVLYERVKTLEGLGAPHRFTITRSKILLWGEGEKDTSTMPAGQLLSDYFPTIPTAELRLVESLPWILSEFVVKTDDGPLMVNSEEERLAVTNQDHHWALFKHQFALRHSLANTGRGLVMTGESQGDSSPYSFGTSLHMGWFQRPDGGWQDIDDAPWAAGWTGWTAMWVSECGNGFIHEFGHSMTMAHFTSGTASNWGIADEYPQDGVHLEQHPWGFDTQRNRFRTWYRVDTDGPVFDEDGLLVGKRDPMNGGESPNAATCFPQYTNYHAQQAQEFFQNNKTLIDGDQGVGVYLWDASTGQYIQTTAHESHQEPTSIDVPVVTIIGTLAQTDLETQIYPAIHAISGNVFQLPDPSNSELHQDYHGGQYVLEIEYADTTLERAMIANTVISDNSLGLFSVNLESEREPVEVRLYRSQESAYPNLDDSDLELMYSRTIEVPNTHPSVTTIGKGNHANSQLNLSYRCEQGFNCENRKAESLWDISTPLRFADLESQTTSPSVCGEEDSFTVLSIPIVNLDGETATAIVHSQRILRNGQQERAFPINDETPWLSSPDLQQGLRVWLPWEENSNLDAGLWKTDGSFIVEGFTADGLFSQTPIDISVQIYDRIAVDLSSEYKTLGLETADSSMYFLCQDPNIGPSSRMWWGTWDGWTELSVPVVNTSTGENTILYVTAQQDELGSRWEMNAGRSAGNNQHHVVVQVLPNMNTHLTPGQEYTTPQSSPLLIDGHRWHDPDAEDLISTFAFSLTYTP